MRIKSIHINGLEHFPDLRLENLNKVISLVGPNGSGKSSLLKLIHLLLNVVSSRQICDFIPQRTEWETFSNATIVFHSDKVIKISHLSEYLGTECSEICLKIDCSKDKFVVREICCDGNALEILDEDLATPQEILNLEHAVASLKKQIDEAIATQPKDEKQRGVKPAKVEDLNKNLKSFEGSVRNRNRITANSVLLNKACDFSRSDFNKMLEEINLPVPVFIPPQTTPDVSIEKLISDLMRLKKGRRHDSIKYMQAVEDLSKLLQSEVDISEYDSIEDMHINGASYKLASTGTGISLAFFGLTKMNDPNCIIIWDEPENGLHPTRRCRLLDLMLKDGRQFFLATHATEFAPVILDGGSVFRCTSEFNDESYKIILNATPVLSRKEAFQTIESLGIYPARTLFTSNVVLWVEGPTELYFLRHWLKKAFAEMNILEGFHYTLMQYGGGLISYLEVIDDGTFEALFDLLSLCRYPVILVDSDVKSLADGLTHELPLKKGALRLKEEIDHLNTNRDNSALFKWTNGREIENYLPSKSIAFAVHQLCKLTDDEIKELDLIHLAVPRFEKYFETLNQHFVKVGVVDNDGKPKGRSLWGEKNKVAFMRAALQTPDFDVSELQFEGQSLIEDIKNFIVRHAL